MANHCTASECASQKPARGRPPSPELRERRRQELYAAAMKLFAERGYRATTLADIAREVGATKGLIYHYARSKADLVGQSIVAGYSTLEQLEEIAASEVHPREKLRRAIESFGAAILSGYQAYMVRFADHSEVIPELEEHYGEQIRRLRARFVRLYQTIVEDGIKSGEFSPSNPRLMAYFVIQGVIGIARWLPGTNAPRDEVLHQVTEMLMASVLAPVDGSYRAGGVDGAGRPVMP